MSRKLEKMSPANRYQVPPRCQALGAQEGSQGSAVTSVGHAGPQAQLGPGLDTGQHPALTALSPLCLLLGSLVATDNHPTSGPPKVVQPEPEGWLHSSYTAPQPSLVNSSPQISLQATPSPLVSFIVEILTTASWHRPPCPQSSPLSHSPLGSQRTISTRHRR